MASSTLLACQGLALPGATLSAAIPTENFGSKICGVQGSFLGQRLALRQARLNINTEKDRSHWVVSASAESPSGGGFLSNFMEYFRNLTSPKPAPSSNGATNADEDQIQDRRTVLVVGSTGRTGRHVVAKLLAKGHNVMALVASLDRFKEVLVTEMGLKEGKNGGAKLTPVVGDALSSPEELVPIVDQCDAIICALGSRVSATGPPPTGDDVKAVYTSGIMNFIKAAQATIKKKEDRKVRKELKLFDFSSEVAPAEEGADVAAPGWSSVDDSMVGGKSASTMVLENGIAVFSGTVHKKVGFAATRGRIENGPPELSPFDGISLRVKGDGKRYKCSLRSSTTTGEYSYQSSFDTVDGEWVTVDLPFDRFRAVNRGMLVDIAPLPVNDIVTVDFLLSKYAYDGFPNLVFSTGPFRLEVAEVTAYRAPRPEFVLLSSAAVDRFARLSGAEERKKSIPIVQLNPGGILTWKLAAEDALRASGLFYTNVRSAGLNDKDTSTPCLLEVGQGDSLTGLISREEAAAVLVEALESPDVVSTTFEVRRDPLAEGLPMKDWTNLFRRLRPDVRSGIVAYSPSSELITGNMELGPPREVEVVPNSKAEVEVEKVPA